MSALYSTVPLSPERPELNALALADQLHFHETIESALFEAEDDDSQSYPDDWRDFGGMGVEIR